MLKTCMYVQQEGPERTSTLMMGHSTQQCTALLLTTAGTTLRWPEMYWLALTSRET